MIASIEYSAFTTDVWTSRVNQSYTGSTIYYFKNRI